MTAWKLCPAKTRWSASSSRTSLLTSSAASFTAPRCPATRLSSTVTSWSASMSWSMVTEPMYPAPPTTRMRMRGKSEIGNWKSAIRTSAGNRFQISDCPFAHLVLVPLPDQASVVAAEAEAVLEDDAHVRLAGLAGHVVQVALRVRELVVRRRVDRAGDDGLHGGDGLDGPGGAEGVADHGLGGTDRRAVGVLSERALDGDSLRGVVELGGGAVG